MTERKGLTVPLFAAAGFASAQRFQFSMRRPSFIINTISWAKCRECGDLVTSGEQVYWIKGHGIAHFTCGWTLADGSSAHSSE